MNLYAGLSIQRAYSAKQQSLGEINWESTNYNLSSKIDTLYRESIFFSFELSDDFIFQYDKSLDYIDILLLRIENYLLIGEFDSAIQEFANSEFECSLDISDETIIECLCMISGSGICPFVKG